MAKRTKPKKPGTASAWGEDDVVPAHIVRAIHPYDVGLQKWVRAAFEAKRKPRKPSLARGRPREIKHEALFAIGEEVFNDVTPYTQKGPFLDEVRDRAQHRHIRVPKRTTLTEILRPFLERIEVAGR
jgi:hypothetical protein